VPNPFDAVLKDVVRKHLADYAALFHLPHAGTVLDVDLSTVSAATDVVLADANPPREGLTTLDFQAGHDPHMDDRVLLYQAVLRSRYHLPVHSVVLLLRPDAYRPPMTGRVRYRAAAGRGKMDFAYELVRIWESPAQSYLEGGIGLTPLAVLGRLPGRRDVEAGLAEVVRELDRRFRTEVEPAEANDLMTKAFVLSGLRIAKAAGAALFRRVLHMKESTTYQFILEEGEAIGEVRGARNSLLALARKKFGRPPKKALAALEQIADVDRLVRMTEAVLDVTTWNDLLAVE
jgi:predicted transposase YdaD